MREKTANKDAPPSINLSNMGTTYVKYIMYIICIFLYLSFCTCISVSFMVLVVNQVELVEEPNKLSLLSSQKLSLTSHQLKSENSKQIGLGKDIKVKMINSTQP